MRANQATTWLLFDVTPLKVQKAKKICTQLHQIWTQVSLLVVLARKTGVWTIWLRTAAPENIKHETHRQIFINFCRFFSGKGKLYILRRLELDSG